jgi:hypothetical protein
MFGGRRWPCPTGERHSSGGLESTAQAATGAKTGFIICHLLPDNNHNQQQFLHVFTLFSAYQRLSVLPAFTTMVVDCHKHIMVVRQFL